MSVLGAGVARAAGGGPACAEVVSQWAARCAGQEQLTLRHASCPSGRIVLGVDGDLDVELVDAHATSFRVVGAFGLSPVGSFADWNREPARRRAAFESVARCVGREPPPAALPAAPAPPGARGDEPGATSAARRLHWLGPALVGLACVVGALALRRRWPAVTRPAAATAPGARELVALAGLLVLAAWLRGHGLASRPLDNDEPVTLTLRGLSEWAASDDARLHPPLMALVSEQVARVAPGLTALRAVSAAAGVVTVLLVWLAARPEGPWAAGLGALYLALAPAAVHVSQLARGYALLALLLMGAHLALWRAVARDRAGCWMLYALLGVLACGCEYAAIVPLAVDAAFAAHAARRSPRLGVALLGACASIVACCSALVPFVERDPSLFIGHVRQVPSGLGPALGQLAAAFRGELGVAVWLAVLAALAYLGRARFAAARGLAGTVQRARAVTLLAIVAALGVLSVFTATRARYALHALPYLAVLVGVLASARLRAAALPFALLLVAEAWTLRELYARTGRVAPELDSGPDLAPLYARFAGSPDLGIVVRPSHASGDVAYRLAALPGPDQRDCPVSLCGPPGRRRVYAANGALDELDEIRRRHAVVLLVDHDVRPPPAGCSEIGAVRQARLFDCSARSSP